MQAMIDRGHDLAPGVGRPDLHRPAPDGLVRDNKTTLKKHFLDGPQAQGETEMEHTAMAMISGGKWWRL